jgi:hypothetical protein
MRTDIIITMSSTASLVGQVVVPVFAVPGLLFVNSIGKVTFSTGIPPKPVAVITQAIADFAFGGEVVT